MQSCKEIFLQLVRLGIEHTDGADSMFRVPSSIDWVALKALAERQGLSAVVLDGIDKLNTNNPNFTNMPQMLRLEWIGEVLQGENIYKHQQAVAVDMAKLFHRNAIRTYVLKGNVVAECYPRPEHRVSVDVDCYLVEEVGFKFQVSGSKGFDAWALGNDLIRAKGFAVNTDFYKNSAFDISGVNVENHQYLTPFRGNRTLQSLERYLQSKLKDDSLKFRDSLKFKDTELCRPPVIVSALFLIEHAYSHFLHEGLTWRMVLDWVLFCRKHKGEIDRDEFDKRIDEFGFRRFFDSFSRLGQYLIGVFQDSGFTFQDKRMLTDIWAPLDLHETVRGWKGKLALAGNTWRARWKYRYFTDMNWMQALWIQVKGFLFEKEPKLG